MKDFFQVHINKSLHNRDEIIGESLKLLTILGSEVSFLGFDSFGRAISLVDGKKYHCIPMYKSNMVVKFMKTHSEVLEFKEINRIRNIINSISEV